MSRLGRDRPRRRERPRGRGPARRRARGARRGPPLRQPAGAAARRRALEPAQPLQRRRSTASRAPASCAGSASARGASTTRCWTPRTACSGLPFHYRDHRTDGMVARAHARVSRDELYATCGIQTMPINTVFQLLADEGSAALAAAERIALVPDLFNLWLTGELANEVTNASTTGLLDARSGTWARELIARLGLPADAVRRRPGGAGADARRARRRAGPPRGQPRHRVGVRRRAAALGARGHPLLGHVVAARARAARAGARRPRERLQPHQRARRSTGRSACCAT